MDWIALATVAGAAIGAAASGFVSARREVKTQLRRPTEGIEAIRTKLGEIDRQAGELRADLKVMREQMNHLVTDDEFGAYTQHTTDAINKLTEKVGRAAGAIEAWYQTRGNRM